MHGGDPEGSSIDEWGWGSFESPSFGDEHISGCHRAVNIIVSVGWKYVVAVTDWGVLKKDESPGQAKSLDGVFEKHDGAKAKPPNPHCVF
jgi:hypothetical protein